MLPLYLASVVSQSSSGLLKTIRCSSLPRASATPGVFIPHSGLIEPWRCGCWGNLGLAYVWPIDAGTALTNRCRCWSLFGWEQFYRSWFGFSGSANGWSTACRNEEIWRLLRWALNTAGAIQSELLHNYCWNSRFYSGMAADFPGLYYSDWGVATCWCIFDLSSQGSTRFADRHLIFWGYVLISRVREEKKTRSQADINAPATKFFSRHWPPIIYEVGTHLR